MSASRWRSAWTDRLRIVIESNTGNLAVAGADDDELYQCLEYLIRYSSAGLTGAKTMALPEVNPFEEMLKRLWRDRQRRAARACAGSIAPRGQVRRPAAFRLIEARTARSDQPFLLCWAPERGYIEPITGQLAAPIIGEIISWQYAESHR